MPTKGTGSFGGKKFNVWMFLPTDPDYEVNYDCEKWGLNTVGHPTGDWRRYLRQSKRLSELEHFAPEDHLEFDTLDAYHHIRGNSPRGRTRNHLLHLASKYLDKTIHLVSPMMLEEDCQVLSKDIHTLIALVAGDKCFYRDPKESVDVKSKLDVYMHLNVNLYFKFRERLTDIGLRTAQLTDSNFDEVMIPNFGNSSTYPFDGYYDKHDWEMIALAFKCQVESFLKICLVCGYDKQPPELENQEDGELEEPSEDEQEAIEEAKSKKPFNREVLDIILGSVSFDELYQDNLPVTPSQGRGKVSRVSFANPQSSLIMERVSEVVSPSPTPRKSFISTVVSEEQARANSPIGESNVTATSQLEADDLFYSFKHTPSDPSTSTPNPTFQLPSSIPPISVMSLPGTVGVDDGRLRERQFETNLMSKLPFVPTSFGSVNEEIPSNTLVAMFRKSKYSTSKNLVSESQFRTQVQAVSMIQTNPINCPPGGGGDPDDSGDEGDGDGGPGRPPRGPPGGPFPNPPNGGPPQQPPNGNPGGGGPPNPPGGGGGGPPGDPNPGTGAIIPNAPNPADNSVRISDGKWINVREIHFDTKLKADIVPTWNGNDTVLGRWILQINEIAGKSESVFRGLGDIVPLRFQGRALEWWLSLSELDRQVSSENWDTLKNTIRTYWMNHDWLAKMQDRAICSSFCKPGYGNESPTEYFIRKHELVALAWNLPVRQTIREILKTAPVMW